MWWLFCLLPTTPLLFLSLIDFRLPACKHLFPEPCFVNSSLPLQGHFFVVLIMNVLNGTSFFPSSLLAMLETYTADERSNPISSVWLDLVHHRIKFFLLLPLLLGTSVTESKSSDQGFGNTRESRPSRASRQGREHRMPSRIELSIGTSNTGYLFLLTRYYH